MKNRIITLTLVFTALLAVLNSCSSDNDEIVEEVENVVSSDNDIANGNEDVNEATTSGDNNENITTVAVEETIESTPESEVAVPQTVNATGNTPIIIEENGRARFEAEIGVFGDQWELRTDKPNFMGEGYLFWSGGNFFGQPGNGVITYNIRIQNPGTYQVEFRQIIAFGRNNNEYNDIWLRFPDADNFFGRNPRNDEVNIPIVFPRGGGSTGPFPKGANTRGWFKIFAKSFNFAFRTVTGDDQGFAVFATFEEPGDYTLELSARSMGYGIDQVILFREGLDTGGLNNTFLSPVILE